MRPHAHARWFSRAGLAAALIAATCTTVVPAAAATTPSTGPRPTAGACDPADAAAVISWNEVAALSLGTDAALPAPPMGVGMAYVQAAVFNAVVGIEGGHPMYRWSAKAPKGASTDAAVAAAAHDVLLHYFPVATTRVETAYTAALLAIPDGPSKTAGVAWGRRAAAQLIASRAGDNWQGVAPPTKAPAPGVWQPTPPLFTPSLAPWMATMKPFLIPKASLVRPGPPPALTSAEYTRALAEVREIGAVGSTTRTAEQTEIARFFAGNPSVQLQGAYRDHLTRHCMSASDSAHYILVATLSGADALIATWDTKQTYQFWRPVTAIRLADTDGNPSTAADPEWTPLVNTPSFPEYISAHCTVLGAVSQAMAITYGPTLDLNIFSSVTGTTRHYDDPAVLRAEAFGARLWGGIHFRFSNRTGEIMGRLIGTWTGISLIR
ncbi:hypothetical protein GIS00_26275 [Nakamurella sp. YIM 132087]|uniref:Phosphatase PAP2 family protein n=1 Tax=Nakamurella alba TaxID=2665158 RepID=A0A7K1FX86_9ACTN|nr:vanadium-dependent haloperoxidase [Nakamurella alba]MTD17444.1 hypothetical protein [Nakamurella alba]